MSPRRMIASGLVAALVFAGCGGSTETAQSSETDSAAAAAAAAAADSAATDSAAAGATETTIRDAEGETALFDASVVHDISVTFDEADYAAMIETFDSTGEKEWIEATVTIDGVTFEQVGLRLKGNSSLRSVGADADPAELPWLIRLDEFVEGQEYQGHEDIVIRSNSSATSLNEAVALDLLAAAGLASQQAASTSFIVNGADAVLRLAIEHPDDDAWLDAAFGEDGGALYKAESTGDWSYRGDDPASYEDVFDQEGGSSLTDLTPLIDFLQFLNEADDETFASELPDRLDVESFARYLAMMDLLDNFDDIDGPGNNAYVFYDVTTEQFTVVPWDLNLAFGASPGGGPGGDTGGAGGFEPRADGAAGQGGPGGFGPPADGGGGAQGGPGGFGRTNVLVERFHENEEFEALYQAALADLEAELFDSGTAATILADRVDTLIAGATDLVEEATIVAEAEGLAARF